MDLVQVLGSLVSKKVGTLLATFKVSYSNAPEGMVTLTLFH